MIRYALLSAALTARADVDRLAWMSGCWTITAGEMVVEETWSRPAGGTMLGWSRTVKGGRTAFFEQLRIESKDGKLVYTPLLSSNQPPVSFSMLRLTDGEVVFENATHDFPQRIIYQRQPGALLARIEGAVKGKERSQEFRYRKTPCP